MGPADFAKRVTSKPPAETSPIAGSKNGALAAVWDDGTKAVVKLGRPSFQDGRRSQRGFPASSVPRREVAFWKLAEVFGAEDLVPETVLFSHQGLVASAQAWAPGEHLDDLSEDLRSAESDEDWARALVTACSVVPEEAWVRLALLDVVAGQRDRHSNQAGVVLSFSKPPSLVVWDNAATFGTTFEGYHQVFHRHLFRDRFPTGRAWEKVASTKDDDVRSALSGLVSEEEIRHACLRRQFVEDFAYRLPWEVFSKGATRRQLFPRYEGHFTEPNKKLDDLPKIFV